LKRVTDGAAVASVLQQQQQQPGEAALLRRNSQTMTAIDKTNYLRQAAQPTMAYTPLNRWKVTYSVSRICILQYLRLLPPSFFNRADGPLIKQCSVDAMLEAGDNALLLTTFRRHA
jgi:hypothetical protein